MRDKSLLGHQRYFMPSKSADLWPAFSGRSVLPSSSSCLASCRQHVSAGCFAFLLLFLQAVLSPTHPIGCPLSSPPPLHSHPLQLPSPLTSFVSGCVAGWRACLVMGH